MDAKTAEIPVIDIDTHFTEPPELWTSRAPERLRERAPRVVRNAQGAEQWVIGDGDGAPFGPPGFCVIRSDGSKLYGKISLESFAEMSAAASQPAARLRTMDELGLAAQILYPNVVGFAAQHLLRIEDAELRLFCITGYNDAVAELQRAGEGRLYPQALLPFWDVELATKELLRARDQLGLRGFTMTDSPERFGLPYLHDPHWDRLWATAQELGTPVNFHIGSGDIGGGGAWPVDRNRTLAAISTILFMNNMRCLTNLIFSGLLDRFPRLNFVSVESGIGWIPFLLEACEYQMDENLVERGGLELRPREYFRRQIYASFWFEHQNVERTLELLGPDHVMFETDFPHPTCLYPSVREQIERSLGGLPLATRRMILHDTAARLYQIDLR